MDLNEFMDSVDKAADIQHKHNMQMLHDNLDAGDRIIASQAAQSVIQLNNLAMSAAIGRGEEANPTP